MSYSQESVGTLIKKSRIKKGLTQRQLADMLFVTDKAISKWERGCSSPDISILTKLASIIDCDIDDLLEKNNTRILWTGLLILDDKDIDPFEIVGGQTIVEHMISYFLLVNIKTIEIVCNDIKKIHSLNLERFKINIFFTPICHKKVFVITSKCFLFGAGLTRLFSNIMSSEINTQLYCEGNKIPFLFCTDGYNKFNINYSKKNIWRGQIAIMLNTYSNIKNAELLIEIYKSYACLSINNLEEIYKNRNH